MCCCNGVFELVGVGDVEFVCGGDDQVIFVFVGFDVEERVVYCFGYSIVWCFVSSSVTLLRSVLELIIVLMSFSCSGVSLVVFWVVVISCWSELLIIFLGCLISLLVYMMS